MVDRLSNKIFMKLKLLVCISLFGLVFSHPCFSQIIVDSKATATNVDFNLINEELVITYDIINSKPGELFLVKISILTEDGKTINAKSFRGDIGEKISGGMGKKIVWEISKDIAFLDNKINVQVEAINQNPKIIQPCSKGKALLLSTFYPGLGSSKVTLKGYHLIKGVIGYGAIAGSFVFRSKADKSSIDYDNATTSADRDKYYNLYQDQKQLSTVLLYGAGAVWLLDYVTVLVSENRSLNKGFKSKLVYLGPSIGSSLYSTGFTMIYKF